MVGVTMTKPSHTKQQIELLKAMLFIRLVEEKVVEVYPEEEIRCPVHLCIGQEAIAVGVIHNLKKDDLVLSNHRGHGHYLAKGGNLKAMWAEMYGKVSGCDRGRGGSMHLIDLSVNFLGSTPIVGGTIPVATGVAFAEKAARRKTATVVFFGDAAVEEGVFHESLNFAALKGLPIVYVCENNLYSVNTRISERQPKRDICRLAAAHGIKTFHADGNDVLKVDAAMKKAIAFIRQGKGPVFLGFPTYRWREHCGPNYDYNIDGYRGKEIKAWQKKCPIVRLEKYLLARRVITPEKIVAMKAGIREEIDDVVERVKAEPWPDAGVSLPEVYAR